MNWYLKLSLLRIPLAIQQERRFPTQLSWHWSINMIKLLPWRVQGYFGPFIMLLVEGSSETRRLGHLSNHVFGVRNFGNKKIYEGHIFSQNVQNLLKISKYSKFNLDFKNAPKKWEKVVCFWDNGIWIDVLKLSLFRTGYLSSAANVLTSGSNVWHVNKREFFLLKCFDSDQ